MASEGDTASERGHGLGGGHGHREGTRPQRGDTASEMGHGLGEGTRPQREDTASERRLELGGLQLP